MTDVSSVLNTTGTAATANKSETDLTNMSTFLGLLVEQLQCQDPLNPMDTNEMTSQLAALSSLQELKNLETGLTTMQTYASSLANASVLNLIGKDVKAVGATLTVPDSGSVAVPYYLEGAAKNVTITITNSSGETVKTIAMANQATGDQTATWDGTDSTGARVASGTYNYAVTATDSSGNTVKADTFIEGIVDSIRYENGVPILIIGDHEVSLGDVYQVNTASGK